MSSITILLNNSLNNPVSNPPGVKIFVGGQQVHDPSGILVDKTDTCLEYTISITLTSLNTWYYDGYSWYSGFEIIGPFVNDQPVLLRKVIL